MLIDDLGSMETVAPPKDFLEQLHRRMERRSWFSQFLYTLTLPMRVKLPMKLAGAVVMVVLVLTIFRIQEDQYGKKITPLVQETTRSEPSPQRVAKAPLDADVQEETYSFRVVREKAKQTTQTVRVVAQKNEAELPPNNAAKEMALMETADHPSREGDSVERSLKKAAPPVKKSARSESTPPRMADVPLETGMQKEADDTGSVWERVKPKPQTIQIVAQKDEAMSLPDNAVKKITHVETKADDFSRKEAPIELSLVIEGMQSTHTLESTSDMEAPRARETRERIGLTIEGAAPTTQLLLPRLREIIERSGGEVVSEKYEEGTPIPEFVYVEIPAEQISMFQNDLQALGELHGTPIDHTGEGNGVLLIQIRLITP
jgi:hypothetical protein